MWGRWGGRRAGGNGSRGAAQLLAERASLQVRVWKRSHLHFYWNTGWVYNMRSNKVEVFIWGHIGPLCCVENKVVFEVDSWGIGAVQQWKRCSSTYRFFSVLYNPDLMQNEEVASSSRQFFKAQTRKTLRLLWPNQSCKAFFWGEASVIFADDTIKMTMDDVGAPAQKDGPMVLRWGL